MQKVITLVISVLMISCNGQQFKLGQVDPINNGKKSISKSPPPLSHSNSPQESKLLEEVDSLNELRDKNIHEMIIDITKDCSFSEKNDYNIQFTVMPSGKVESYKLLKIKGGFIDEIENECFVQYFNEKEIDIGEVKIIPTARNSKPTKVIYTYPLSAFNESLEYEFELNYWSENKGAHDFVDFSKMSGYIKVDRSIDTYYCHYSIQNECDFTLASKYGNSESIGSRGYSKLLECNSHVADIFIKVNKIFGLDYANLKENRSILITNSSKKGKAKFFRISDYANPGFCPGYDIVGEIEWGDNVVEKVSSKFGICESTGIGDNFKGGIIEIMKLTSR